MSDRRIIAIAVRPKAYDEILKLKGDATWTNFTLQAVNSLVGGNTILTEELASLVKEPKATKPIAEKPKVEKPAPTAPPTKKLTKKERKAAKKAEAKVKAEAAASAEIQPVGETAVAEVPGEDQPDA